MFAAPLSCVDGVFLLAEKLETLAVSLLRQLALLSAWLAAGPFSVLKSDDPLWAKAAGEKCGAFAAGSVLCQKTSLVRAVGEAAAYTLSAGVSAVVEC